jgi:hypothetical protein
MNMIPIDLDRRLGLYLPASLLCRSHTRRQGLPIWIYCAGQIWLFGIYVYSFSYCFFSRNCYQRTETWDFGRLNWIYRASHVCS